MRKVLLLNYIANKTFEEKIEMDNLYYDLKDYILFSRKIYGPTKKGRYINDKLYGIKLKIS